MWFNNASHNKFGEVKRVCIFRWIKTKLSKDGFINLIGPELRSGPGKSGPILFRAHIDDFFSVVDQLFHQSYRSINVTFCWNCNVQYECHLLHLQNYTEI